MGEASDKKKRRSIRLKNYDYSSAGIYFITICTYNRIRFFNDIRKKVVAENCWLDIPNQFRNVELDEYIIMPDHIHGIIIIKNVGAQFIVPKRIDKSPTHDLCDKPSDAPYGVGAQFVAPKRIDKSTPHDLCDKPSDAPYDVDVGAQFIAPKRIDQSPRDNVDARFIVSPDNIPQNAVPPDHPNVDARFIVSPDSPNVRARFIVPPDNLPPNIVPNNPMLIGKATLGKIIRAYKAKTTHLIRNVQRLGPFGWQRNYYDHIVRNERELNAIRNYIIHNYLTLDDDNDNRL